MRVCVCVCGAIQAVLHVVLHIHRHIFFGGTFSHYCPNNTLDDVRECPEEPSPWGLQSNVSHAQQAGTDDSGNAVYPTVRICLLELHVYKILGEMHSIEGRAWCYDRCMYTLSYH